MSVYPDSVSADLAKIAHKEVLEEKTETAIRRNLNRCFNEMQELNRVLRHCHDFCSTFDGFSDEMWQECINEYFEVNLNFYQGRLANV